MSDRTRREILRLATSTVIATELAGCSDSDPGSSGGGATDAQAGSGDTDGGSGDSATMSEDLDLRESNVVGVEFQREGASVSFDVTLHHDDEGEEGYANWWQVERLDGTRIGRRELLHPHSRQPFTRSDQFEIPEDVSCVVVRGHDQTHGYGGQAMLVDLDSGATRAVKQGSEKQSFTDSDCP